MATQLQVNTAPLHRLTEALRVFEQYTHNPELQMQTMRAFLFIAARHPSPVSLGEAEKLLGLTQTTASRNFGYLAKGNAKRAEGYKLIEVYEDEFYRRRKLARLTSKGAELANKLAGAML